MKHLLNDRDVVTIAPSASLREAATEMATRRVGSLLVVDGDGLPVGIVTDRDLCTRTVAFDRDPDESTVARAMTAPLRTITEMHEPMARIAAIRKAGARRLPILNEAGQATALVTADDEIRWIADVLSHIAGTAHPSRFHGALRPPGALLDDLEHHLNVTDRVDESDGMSCAAMMEAIQKLRSGLVPASPASTATDAPA
ncbi:MAG: CBS domain-containing protein [Planctomycetota bacterium]|jgi:CBS domain-containing protein